MMGYALIAAGIVLLLGGAAALRWARRAARRPARRPRVRPAAQALPQREEEPAEAVRCLVRDDEELQALYLRLGYDLGVEHRARKLLDTLKNLIRAEVPDFEALRQALDLAPALPGGEAGGAHPAERFLGEVVAAGADEQTVRALLNRAPVEEPLPFVEVLPVPRDGRVDWRPVQEVRLVHKRPSDPRRFSAALDALEGLVEGGGLVRSEHAERAVLAAVAALRTAAARPPANVPLALRGLEVQLDQWLRRAHLPEPFARKQALDAFLHALVRLRHRLDGLGAGSAPDALAACQTAARSLAARYRAASWMHGPRLAERILVALLDAELAGLPGAERALPTAPAGAVQRVRDELAAGYYDRGVLLRRLQDQEARGLYVSSLVPALLRLDNADRAPGTPPAETGARAGPAPFIEL